MTLALPGGGARPELALAFEESIPLVAGRVWIDVRHDAGEWYGSLRIKDACPAIDPPAGVNGFCDVWNGPHASRSAAMSNGYAFGRHQAIAAHIPSASQLHRSLWTYFS